MNIEIFAINLDRSVERWDALSKQAADLGLDLVRVAGVDGSSMAASERVECDEKAFARNNGRTLLSGEYGCYRSHLKALAAFLESGDAFGIIVEDDLVLTEDLCRRTVAAFEACPRADVIKLFNHRVVWFRHYGTSSLGDEIGRAAHGPQGSAACYGVSRSGAAKLQETLRWMEYPWDVALERGWAHGIEIYTTRGNVAKTRDEDTTIASRETYRSTKFPWWRRLNTYGLRLLDDARRLGYARRG
ncbi:MAG: glycosyltransferase family 25 protein [Pseudorhizobium sp.]